MPTSRKWRRALASKTFSSKGRAAKAVALMGLVGIPQARAEKQKLERWATVQVMGV